MPAELRILITAQNQAKAVLSDLHGDLEKTSGIGSKVGTALKVGVAAGAVAATAAIGGLTAVLGASVKAASEAEDIAAQLEAVLKSTEGVAGVTAEAINEQALALSKLTKFEDDAIVKSSALLLTFTKVGKDVFPDAQKAILNVSQAMGTDLQSATIMVGKALNDPVKGMNAMSRAGIQFTAEQKAMIEGMVAAGDAAGAQRAILKELETQFGGSAEAAGKTLSGQLEILKNALGNVKEEIGFALIPALTELAIKFGPSLIAGAEKFAGLLTEKIIPGIKGALLWFGKLADGLSSFVKYIGIVLEDGDTWNDWITHLPEGVQGITMAIGDAIVVVKEFGSSVKDAWDKAKNAFTSTEGSIFVKLKAVVETIDWNAVWESVKAAANTALGQAQAIAADIWLNLKAKWNEIDWSQLKENIRTALAGLIGEEDANKVFAGVEKAIAKLGEIFGPTIERIKGTLAGFGDEMAKLKPKFDRLVEALGMVGEKLKPLAEAFLAVVAAIGVIGAKLEVEAIGQAIERLPEIIGGVTDALTVAATNIPTILGQLGTAVQQAMAGNWDAAFRSATDAVGTFVQTVGDLLSPLGGIVDQVVGGIYDTIVNTINDLTGATLPSWEEFKAQITGAFDEIKAKVQPVLDFLRPLVVTIGAVIGDIGTAIGKFFASLKPLGETFGEIGSKLGELFQTLSPLGTLIAGIAGVIGAALSVVGTVVATVFGEAFASILRNAGTIIGGFASVVLGVIEVLTGIFQAISAVVKAVFEGDFAGAAEAGKRAFANMGDGIKTILEGLGNIILGFVGTIYDTLVGAFNKIPGVNLQMWDEVTNGFKFGVTETAKSADAVKGTIDAMGQSIGASATTAATTVKQATGEISTAVSTTGADFAAMEATINTHMVAAANLTGTNAATISGNMATIGPATQAAVEVATGAIAAIPASVSDASKESSKAAGGLVNEILNKFENLKTKATAPKEAFGGITKAAVDTSLIVSGTLAPVLARLTDTVLPDLQRAITSTALTWVNVFDKSLRLTWQFITDKLNPTLTMLAVTDLPMVQDAARSLASTWTNVLEAALRAAWTFVTDSLVPTLLNLAQSVLVEAANQTSALAGMWTNVLLPALTGVRDYILSMLVPAFWVVVGVIQGSLANAMSQGQDMANDLSGALSGIVGAADAAGAALERLADVIRRMPSLPRYLQSSSPTPMEMGLRGIASALVVVRDEVQSLARTDLAAALPDVQPEIMGTVSWAVDELPLPAAPTITGTLRWIAEAVPLPSVPDIVGRLTWLVESLPEFLAPLVEGRLRWIVDAIPAVVAPEITGKVHWAVDALPQLPAMIGMPAPLAMQPVMVGGAMGGQVIAPPPVVTISIHDNTFSSRTDIDYILAQLDQRLRLDGAILPQ